MILNYNNIEDLVLKNNNLLNKLPHHLRIPSEQWKLGQMIPALRATGQKAKLDFLNSLTPADLKIIQSFFNFDHLTLEKLDYSKVKNHIVDFNNLNDWLNQTDWILNDFCICRDDQQIYISTWR
jgi:hypothetical protein